MLLYYISNYNISRWLSHPASIVLPSKKAIRKASDGEYDYSGRRRKLEGVIAKPHTERQDMEWDEKDAARCQSKS